MAKKKQLTIDPVTNKLSRLKSKDLPLIGITGLDSGDSVAPFGVLESDIIEYCVYDTSDNYLASGQLEYPLPTNLDIGAQVRGLGYERGTYKVVYNFLRQIGGSNKIVLVKKSDKNIYKEEYFINTDGKIYAGTSEEPIVDNDGNQIELLVQEDKFWLQEVSPSRTEIRLRPNPGIDDLDYYEQFRLLGYTCLSYSDISGESYITFSTDGKTATLNGSSISLSDAMKDGTLKIREAFVLDYEGESEETTRYTPVIETEQFPPSKNLITNGHFQDGLDVSQRTNPNDWPTNEIVEFPNPGHSKYCLRMTSADEGGVPGNQYRIRTGGLIPGESYIASCWVMWDDDWDSLTDQGTIFIKTSDGSANILNYPTHGIVSEEKDILSNPSTGNTSKWKRVHGNFTAEEDTIQWIIGYQAGLYGYEEFGFWQTGSAEPGAWRGGNRAGYRYFTDIQLEPGSITGVPTPYMVEERVEETEVPATGLITFEGEDGLVKATFADEDSGFIDLMGPDNEGRGSGKLTIKDAYVLDEVYGDNPAVAVIDDIPIANSSAREIRENGYEGEFLESPYHDYLNVIGQVRGPGELSIRLQVDWEYTLEHLNAAGGVIGGWQNEDNWKKSKLRTIPDFNETDKLRLTAHNIKGPAGFLAKINHTLYTTTKYKTGDPGSEQVFPTGTTVASDNPGVWNIVSEEGVNYVGAVDYIHDYRSDGDHSFWKKKWIHEDLHDCTWIWSDEQKKNQTLVWEWQPVPVADRIWKYWDPNLHSDAVWPVGWSHGFQADHENPASRGHNSGWIGYHGQWVQGKGQFGETCMKFIDQNSEFEYPNHIDYTGLYKTGDYSGDSPKEMTHRWLGISQDLPHTMASQGIEAGDEIKITWWQKTDTEGKGANVGLYHYLKSSDGRSFGEFLQFIPCSKVGVWEQVSYISTVEDDWDLSRVTRLYVYGNSGPEGILWAENVQIELVSTSNEVSTEPVTADFVGEINSISDKNTLVLKDTYEEMAPDGYISDNNANIYSYNTFTEFYVDYTSSLSTLEATYGSFRGDIESISGNSITLKNSYSELGESLDHDFENELGIGQNSQFNNWFIQYPVDNSEDLSKLVRLGPNNYSLITNFKIDTITYKEYPYSVAYKLYEPLSDEVQKHDFVNIVREMIPPVEETCTLIPFVEEEITDIVLRTPEFANTNSPIGAGQTEFKNYNQLTSTDVDIKKKVEDELLSGSLSADINIDHSQFSNFVHFGSVEKRVRNFKYKLDLIEQYTDRSASLAGSGTGSVGVIGVLADPVAGGYLSVSGSESPHPPFTPVSGSLTQIQSWEKKRRDAINNFDKFEKYMFNNSSSYSSESIGVFNDNAWPKRGGSGTYSYPYILARTSQSSATTWYANQLVSASVYDRANKNRIRGHLPEFIIEDTENTVFLNFIDMIGHYFDDIWVFIKAITDVHDKRDKLTEGISKDLLHNVAQSLGWEVYNGKDLISLPRYIFGMEQTGSETPWQYSGTSDRDISREVWSRIINNMPYFLKSKGTSRAIKGLISCYGIPSSILRVIEYGGPKLPGQPPDFFLTRKFTKALDFFGASNNTYVQNETWQPVTLGDAPTSRHPDTVEFRFKTVTGSNQVLVRRGNDWAIRLKDNGSSDRYGYVSFMLSGSNGYNEISSSELPVYDGEFWSVMLTRTSASGYHLSDNSISQDVVYSLYTKQYNAGRSKIVYESTSTLVASGSLGTVSQSYNASYTGSGTTVTIGGPEENTYFGESLSGSMMEYRNWTLPLIESAFDNHVASPISFDGNTPSASYLDLVTRYSFDDNKDLSVGANQWFQDVSADQSFTSSATPSGYTSGMGDHFSSVVDENKMKVPNLGPSRRSSNKLRIEADKLIDTADYLNPKLKFGESITVPAYDNASIDSNKLGIFFSPSAVIDEDIITSMPNLDFDQYIGDPRDQYKEQYTGLVTARNLYWQKYSGPNNFWDYLRLLKYYDSSLYKQLRDLVPARANANIGILIEPTILERDKIIIGKEPEFEPQHHTTFIDTMAYISESATYPNYETNVNYSNEFKVGPYQETGSYVSASSNYPNYEVGFTITDPFRVNFHTNESGSYVSASALYDDLPSSINLYDPFLVNSNTQLTGSGVSMSADFNYYSAPTNTFSEIAAGTGSFVGKEFLERPALYNIGDIDYSGWYGSDYYNATIQEGSQKSIFEEVVMPRVRNNVFSELNREEEFFYSSSLSASLHKPYSSSFVLSDFDNRWDESTGTERLFYLGCVQDDESTGDKTPAVEVTFTTPTKITTGTDPNSRLNVVNKGFQPK